MTAREKQNEGTTDLWKEFISVLPLIKDEYLIYDEADREDIEVFENPETGLHYGLDCSGEVYSVSYDVMTEAYPDVMDLNKWSAIQYSIRVSSYGKDDEFYETDRFRLKDGGPPAMQEWLRLKFHQRNIRQKPDLEKIFAGRDIRIVSKPGYDHDVDFLAMLRGIGSGREIRFAVLRFRYVTSRDPEYLGYAHVEFSYSVGFYDFWAVFPFLGEVWSVKLSEDSKGAEHEIQKVRPDAMLEMQAVDCEKEDFMQFLMRDERTYWDLIPTERNIAGTYVRQV